MARKNVLVKLVNRYSIWCMKMARLKFQIFITTNSLIKINDQEFPLRYSYEGTLGTSCTYGNERISWRRRTEGYQLSEDIKETLRINSGDSNVKIVYYAQSGNQRYKTEFPIGDKTIQSWRRIDKLYHKMAERNKLVENESEESNINTPNVLNDEE